MHFSQLLQIVKNQKGAVAIIVGLCLFMFIGFAALSIDIGNLFVARNELQNAADAGALAGARYLYNTDGTLNSGANLIAYEAATANKSQNSFVEVNWFDPDGLDGPIDEELDIQRGHYSFTTKIFTPNDSLEDPNLEATTWELDNDTNFINAMRVVTRRKETPVRTFFAGIFGYDSFEPSATYAEAIAYIGFAGELFEGDIDQPIALCSRALVDDQGGYSCSIGRMINSGGNVETSNTGGWTSFNQNNPCSGGTNASEMKGLICSGGNPEPIRLGEEVATSGGEIQTAFKAFYDCWVDHSEDKTELWEISLLVIECDKNNVDVCQIAKGAVNVTIVWINDQNDPHYKNAPTQMAGWPTVEDTAKENWDDDGELRWASFVDYFSLKNLSENGMIDAPYDQKSIYFLPSCEAHEPKGTTGGENFGILARIPVLVR